ncbi:MAG: PD-(D/E)XK nuclease family protein [Halobacteriota archaeon]
MDGKSVPSVNTILDIVDKPQLARWTGQRTREFIKKELLNSRDAGTLEDVDLDAIVAESVSEPTRISDRAADNAITLHRLITLSVRNKLDIVCDHPVVTAFHAWREATQFDPIASETLVINHEHEYAGVIDLVGTVHGRLAVVDVKTGYRVYPVYQLELAAYAAAWAEMTGRIPEVCLNLHVKNDSTIIEANIFTGVELFSLFQTFLAARRLFAWRFHNPVLVNQSTGGQGLSVAVTSNGNLHNDAL